MDTTLKLWMRLIGLAVTYAPRAVFYRFLKGYKSVNVSRIRKSLYITKKLKESSK